MLVMVWSLELLILQPEQRSQIVGLLVVSRVSKGAFSYQETNRSCPAGALDADPQCGATPVQAPQQTPH